MIEKAVFSYFNHDESFGNRCGFMTFGDFLFTTSLSVLCASRHFKEVQIISSDWGNDVFKAVQLPVTSYSNSLNQMKRVSKFFWAYGKLIAYCEQDKPFVHIDNDVFLNNPLPERILMARLCFQSHEPFHLKGYHYYNLLKNSWREAPVRPKSIVDNEVTDFAYNCGICGGHDLLFFKEWKKNSEEYIFAPENFNTFFKKFDQVLIHQNLFHEQYFAACLIKKHRMRKKVEVLNKDAMELGKDETLKYTHLWGTTKTDKGLMARVRMRLYKEDKALFERVFEFVEKNKI
jgi:hypothetical protein